MEKLRDDLLKNVNFINFSEAYEMYDFIEVDEGIGAIGRSDRPWVYISCEKRATLQSILEHYNREICFAAVEDWMLEDVMNGHEVKWQLSCDKLYYPQDHVLKSHHHQVSKLDVSEAEYIFTHYDYKAYTNLDYVRERIAYGEALGIYDHGVLVAWLMTHDDGAMGFLQVLKTHRNKGYALALTVDMIKLLRGKDKIPFVHIESDNVKSQSLAKKMGFVNDRRIHWLELED